MIKNIIIVIAILSVVFLSQQPYFRQTGERLYSQAETQVKNNLYPMVSGEVEQKSAFIQEEIAKQKNNFAQNVWGDIKNYFAGIFSKVSGTPVQ